MLINQEIRGIAYFLLITNITCTYVCMLYGMYKNVVVYICVCKYVCMAKLK